MRCFCKLGHMHMSLFISILSSQPTLGVIDRECCVGYTLRIEELISHKGRRNIALIGMRTHYIYIHVVESHNYGTDAKVSPNKDLVLWLD